MRARRLAVPLLVLALSSAPMLLMGVTTAAAATPSPPAFTAPLPLYDKAGASTNGSEPSIHVDSKDNVYVSAPAGVPTGGCPFWTVHKDAAGYDYRGTIDTDHASVGGGDCDISSTPSTTPGAAYDNVSVTSLSLANLTSNVTTDGGATFSTVANPVSQQAFVVDRQWQAADPTLGRHYLTVHDGTANIQVSVSTDGGYQYIQNTFAIDPTKNRKALSSGVSISVVDGSNHFGALVVDPTNHHLYIPFLAPLEGTTGFNENTLYISEGDPCPSGACTTPAGTPSPISWTTYKAFDAPVADNLSNDFPALTMGSDGTLYAAFTGAVTNPATSNAGDEFSKSRIFVLHSTLKHSAATWAPPQAVDPGTGNANVFPWLVAGSDGNVGVAWYASTLAGTTCPGAGAAGNGTSVSDNCLNVWHVAYAQSSDGNTSSPTWTVTDVSGTVHKGPICNKGLSCATGTRTMLDFFDVALDSAGRTNLVYVSDMRQLDTADVTYTRQCGGTSLTGVALADAPCSTGGGAGGGGTTGGAVVPACPTPAITDAEGDATQVIVADTGQSTVNQKDLDIRDGNLAWSDATGELVALVHVSDLAAAPGSSEYLRFDFKLNNITYEITAKRDNTGATSFSWSQPGLGATSLGSLVGTFDDAKSAITVALPAAAYAAAQPTQPPLGLGSVISTMSVLTQRVAGVVTATADSATSGACVYTVAAGPIVPEVPYAALLPLVAGGLLGAVELRRRRRRSRLV
ncbi:MAG: hypothetical protein QOE99_3639 [Actinomycetota bacterium]|nr:hypothetical protein [Actinomycetota bacterium]